MNWQANWIWTEEKETRPRNRWQCFRRSFQLENNLPDWGQAELSITADARYVLYVNGELIGRGPARSWPFEQAYDSYEIGYLLKRNEPNVIAVIVLHFGLSTFSYLRGRGGLLVQLDFKSSASRIIHSIGTDTRWKTLTHPGYNPRSQRISCQLGFTEYFDSRPLSESWTGSFYDDSPWAAAKVIGPVGTEPWRQLVPRDIPLLTQEAIWPRWVESLYAVKPVSWTAALDMRTAMMPSSVNHANEIKVKGYLATVIRVAVETGAILGFPDISRKFGPVIVNGKVYDFDQSNPGLPERYLPVPLQAGDNLFLVDFSGRYHGHAVHLGIDCDAPFELVSPLEVFTSGKAGQEQKEAAREEASPFVIIGPFEAQVFIDHDNLSTEISEREKQRNLRLHSAIAICTRAEDLMIYSNWIRPLPLSLISPESIFSRFVWAKKRFPRPVPASLQNVVMANRQAGEIPRFEGADSEFVIDFGQELSGYISFEVESPASAVLDFYGIEYLNNGWRQQTYELDNTLHYVCHEGRQHYTSLVRRGLRYLLVMVRYSELEEAKLSVKFFNIQMLQSNYPVAEIGQFNCSDQLLNSIWQISQHTTRLCMEDTFVDCPAYEQVFWVGDSRNAALVNYYLFGSNELVKRCLKLVPGSRFQSPLYVDQLPSGWNSVIPNWTFFWVLACYEYYEQTGELTFIKEIWPHVRYTLDHYLQKLDERGLFNIQAWNLLDWAPLDQPENGAVAHQNMFLVKALTLSAELARVAEDSPRQNQYLQAALLLKENINEHLWSGEERAYRDSIHADGQFSDTFSVQTQIVALICEVAEGERAASLARYLKSAPSYFVKAGSPFMAFFYYEALAKFGMMQEMLEDMRLHYGQMLKHDATTCWEMYPGYSGTYPDSRFLTRSHCHAWSAAPAYFLPAYILGVRSLTPGWQKIVVEPQPGDLKWARGTVPLPDAGSIRVEWQVGTDEHIISIEVWYPAEIEVTVNLPLNFTAEVKHHKI